MHFSVTAFPTINAFVLLHPVPEPPPLPNIVSFVFETVSLTFSYVVLPHENIVKMRQEIKKL